MIRADPSPGLRFGSKIVLLLVLLVLTAQAATFGVMRYATERSVGEQLRRELDVGERVWQRLHDTRSRQLLGRVAVLAEDFGFREAVSTADLPTMQSALANAGGRIGADAAVLLDPRGVVQVELLPGDARFAERPLRSLLERANQDGQASGVLLVDEQPYRLALVPVFAPRLVAWVGLAQEFGVAEAREFAAITALDASVLSRRGELIRWHGSSASPPLEPDLDPALWVAAPSAPARDIRLPDDDGDQPSARALIVSDSDDVAVHLLISASRQAAMAPFVDLGRQVLLLSFAVAVVALVIAVLVGRQVSRPVDRLARAAQRIQRGEYKEAVQVSAGGELGQLAGAFNQMQAAIAEREATIRHQANHDRLTGLPNREHALSVLKATLQEASAQGALLSLDLDRFKETNDTLGHGFGDQVLIEAGRRLGSSVHDGDIVARLGADEFLLLLHGVDADDAVRRAERVADSLRVPFGFGDTAVRLDSSIGIAAFPAHGTHAETLLRRADIAMHEAKQAHGGVALYSLGRDELHLRQLRLLGDLRRCIERNELTVVYQPKVSLVDGRVEHAEALLRWRHPEFGPVPPDEFIPLAERSGLIQGLTRYVLGEAIGQVSEWQRSGIESGVAINLSAEDLLSGSLPEHVRDCLREHSVSPAKLIFEVTESSVMRDLDRSLVVLHSLRRMGIRIAIDDFGTGQSSLAQLKRLPIDELKIDKSFVLSLAPGGEDELIVRSIIDLAHTLSMRVVAEGVETAIGLGLLRQYGCEVAQGYHFSRPLSATDFGAWIERSQPPWAAPVAGRNPIDVTPC